MRKLHDSNVAEHNVAESEAQTTKELPKRATAPSVTLIWSAAIAVSLAVALLCSNSQLDDPYIFSRYARNLLRFHDTVWNPNWPRIEGFSSWIWLGVQATALALHLPPIAASRFVGLLSLLALGASLAYRSVRTLRSLPSQLIAAGLFVSAFDLGFYATCGMDNILWTLVVWLMLWRAATRSAITRRDYLFAALAFFVRPEGFLLLVPFAVEQLFRLRRSQSSTLSSDLLLVARTASPGVALLALFFSVRRVLYCAWLPNAAAAKHFGGPLLQRVFTGLLYLGGPANLYIWPVVFALLFLSMTKQNESPSTKWFTSSTVSTAAFGVCALGLMLVGGGDDVAAFEQGRLIIPLVVPLLWVVAEQFDEFATRRLGSMAPLVAFAMVIVMATPRVVRFKTLWQASTGATNLTSTTALLTSWRTAFREAPISPLSAYLKEHTGPNEYIAVPWAGRIPYETDLPTIDIIGLNDAHISRATVQDRGIDVRFDYDYTFSMKPRFVCHNVHVRGSLDAVARLSDEQLRALGGFGAGHRTLLRHPMLRAHYQVDPDVPSDTITCFRRID